jgi:hypothetical protein
LVRRQTPQSGKGDPALATVHHYQYTHYNGTVFPPGGVHWWTFGPWDWYKKGVVVTAQPFSLSTAHRELAVTDLRVRSVPAQPVAEYYVDLNVRNVGPDPVVIYYVTLVEIGA